MFGSSCETKHYAEQQQKKKAVRELNGREPSVCWVSEEQRSSAHLNQLMEKHFVTMFPGNTVSVFCSSLRLRVWSYKNTIQHKETQHPALQEWINITRSKSFTADWPVWQTLSHDAEVLMLSVDFVSEHTELNMLHKQRVQSVNSTLLQLLPAFVYTVVHWMFEA